MTVREALAEGRAALDAAGLDRPDLDAALLLAEVTGRGRAALVAAGPEALDAAALAAFRRLVERRRGGECAAYILGRKEFYGLDFAVSPAVLVPRPDTETLVEAALEKLCGRQGGGNRAADAGPARALDLCTGSGAVAVALQYELPELEIWAVDISAEALAVARLNARRLLPRSSIRFLEGDLFEALADAPPFALIAANPPYVPRAEIDTLPREVRGEPLLALDGGVDGLAVSGAIIARAPDFLLPGGMLLMEADPRQTPPLAALLAQRGFDGIQIWRDLSGRERVIGGMKP